MRNLVLGVDIGGTGIKAAPVNLATGRLVAEHHRIKTPRSATPAHIEAVLEAVTEHFDWKGPIGIGFPGVVKRGVVHTAAHLDAKWVGRDAARIIADRIGGPVTVINDADAAGLAEVRFGAGAGVGGVVLMVTLGTGIGSGLFLDGVLVPNTEFGHLELDGRDAERRAAASVRERKHLSWKQWGRRVGRYLRALENLLWPDLIIIGGGVSTEFDKFKEYLETRTKVVAAAAGNNAGIVGAALATRTGGVR